jgi:hypothetical protein
MTAAWSAPTSPEVMRARANGRRSYNASRHFQVQVRRGEVLRLLVEYGCRYGVQSRIARELGVSHCTISRDVAALLNRTPGADPDCPWCLRPMPQHEYDERSAAVHVASMTDDERTAFRELSKAMAA